MTALSDDERAALLAFGQRKYFRNKEIIVLQGGPGDSLFVLTAGVVKVTRSTESGIDTTLAIRYRGELIGEVALLAEKPRGATAYAVGNVATVKITRASFDAFAKQHREAKDTIMKSIMAKMQESDERLALRSREAGERLAMVVYNLALASPDREADGSVLITELTQSDVAHLADASRVTAERFFRDLRDKDILVTGYRKITIRDIDMLEKLATRR